jgi:hypothetical protein
MIVLDYPDILAEFRRKRFSLLWRGGRDGFGAHDFHRRCDGHANTVTVILDTDGNIFGGFTPVEWEYHKGDKVDESLRSFLFTLRNPHNFSAWRFALKAEKKNVAVVCYSDWGPDFWDIDVSDNCNASTCRHCCFGSRYTNDTGLDGKTFFTDFETFQRKGIADEATTIKSWSPTLSEATSPMFTQSYARAFLWMSTRALSCGKCWSALHMGTHES